MNASIMSSWSSLLVLVLLVVGRQHQANANVIRSGNCQTKLSRLYTNIQPSDYILKLTLEPKKEGFSGSVKIMLDIKISKNSESSKSETTTDDLFHPSNLAEKGIILNGDGLIVTDAKFKQAYRDLFVEGICYDAESKILAFVMNRKLRDGPATLIVDFNGEMQVESKGLFKDNLNSDAPTLVTNLKPNYARRLFPCFDEPQFKATFRLSIYHTPGTLALSNMKTHGKSLLEGGFVLTNFLTTSKISTYLLSLAVGEFGSIEKSVIDKHMKIIVRTPIGWKQYAEEMAIMAAKAYNELGVLFAGLTQPLQKIDIVAVGMEPVATENWGLFTMSWELLSAGEQKSKPDVWIRAVTVLIKQMIHQRLATLFTVSWWDDRWIIEGLAAYLASEQFTRLYPDTDYESYTLVDTTFSAMNDDDLKPRSINGGNLRTADDFEASFDSFAHKKSAALVRMFARFYGEENFKSSIRDLILSNDAQNPVEAKVWLDVLSSKAPHYGNMREVAHHWTEQVGYPLVTVHMQDEHTLSVSQCSEQANGQVWPIPIQFELHAGSEGSIKEKFVLPSFGSILISLNNRLNIFDENHWLEFNAHQGYYRVTYLNDQLMHGRSLARRSGRMLAARRLQCLSDARFSMRGYNTADFETLLSWLLKYGKTTDGEVLLLTRMLSEMHDNGSFPLASTTVVADLMNQYLLDHGANTNLLVEYTRSQVADYLANGLKYPDFIRRIMPFMVHNLPVPPFLQQAIENMRRRGLIP